DSPNGWGNLLEKFVRAATTYHPVVAPLALILRVNDSLVERTFAQVTDQELWQRPTDKSNPMLWIFGHIVNTRVHILAMFGEAFNTGWGDVFDRGAGLTDAVRYPSRERIQAVSQDVNAKLYAKLGTLASADLEKPATRSPVPAVQIIA